MNTGQKIAKLRSDRGWSQPQLAEKLNVGTSTVGMWETNKRNPGYDDLIKIAEIFGVSTDYLLGNNQTPKWATEKDVVELNDFLNSNRKFAYNGDSLTEEEKEKLNVAMTQIFWKRHKHGSDSNE